MAKAVVYCLKAVQIKKEECERRCSLIGLSSNCRLEKLNELIPIRKSGECVMIRGMSKLFAALSKGFCATFKLFYIVLQFLDMGFGLLGPEAFRGLC